MSRFCVSPREENLLQVFRIFGYLKKYPNKAIGVVDRESIINKKVVEDMTTSYGFEDQYAYAYEEMHESYQFLSSSIVIMPQ